MKKILITGANSYIGTSFENYMKQWAEEYEVSVLETKNLIPEKGMFVEYDVVFHVAGIAHIKESRINHDMYYKVNRDLSFEVAKVAKNAGVKQFVILSSMSVYGINVGHITKDAKEMPNTAYGKSKSQADELISQLASEDFKIAILRPPMVYGKGCKGNYQSLRKFATKFPIFPNYKNLRSMIYIGNLCEFVKKIIDSQKEGMFFPQNSEYVCTSEMAKLIAKANGKKQIQVSLFNVFIKHLPISILDKVFGNLTYEKVDIVNKYNFEESVLLSEQGD